jgi:hypothetical protein
MSSRNVRLSRDKIYSDIPGDEELDTNEEIWQHEWRRNGTALMGVTGVGILGWYDASQTFIVQNANRLAHPSFWNWILIPLAGGFIAGTYFFLATYRPWPLIGRSAAKHRDEQHILDTIQSALLLETVVFQEAVDEDQRGLNIHLHFTNGQNTAIQYIIESIELSSPGIQTDPLELNRSGRLLPGRRLTLQCPSLLFGNSPYPWKGTFEFRTKYGPIGMMRFAQDHITEFSWNGSEGALNDVLISDSEIVGAA